TTGPGPVAGHRLSAARQHRRPARGRRRPAEAGAVSDGRTARCLGCHLGERSGTWLLLFARRSDRRTGRVDVPVGPHRARCGPGAVKENVGCWQLAIGTTGRSPPPAWLSRIRPRELCLAVGTPIGAGCWPSSAGARDATGTWTPTVKESATHAREP